MLHLESFRCRGHVSHCACDRKFCLLPLGLMSQKKNNLSLELSSSQHSRAESEGGFPKAHKVVVGFSLSCLIRASFKNYTFPFQSILCFVFLIGLIFFYFCGVLGSERKVKYIVFHEGCSFSSGN